MICNWGILGPGKIARKFADDLKHLPDARLHAVASSSLERAQSFARDYGCPNAFGAYADLLDCPDLDIVYIATPHAFHYEQTMMCLERGIAVLCEKPFSLHPEQTRAMIALAKAKNVFLMEALWTLFIPGYRQALEWAKSGKIGRIHSAKADFGYFSPYQPQSRIYDPALGGGSLMDIGIYPALFFLDLLGVPQHIQATGTLTPDGVDGNCAFLFRYPDQSLAIGHSSVMAHTPTEATIYGSEGQIHLHSRFHHTHQLTVKYASGQPEDVVQYPFEGWGYHFEAAHVMACLAAGQKESPVAPLHFTQTLSDTLFEIARQMGVQYTV